MKNSRLPLIAALLIFLFPLTLAAGEPTEQLAFAPVILKGNNITPALMNNVFIKIMKHLRSEEFFVINDRLAATDKISYDNCLKKQCITELAGITSGGIVVLISLSAEDVKTGERPISRYMTEDIKERRYTIHVATADIFKSEYDLVFKKTFNDTAPLMNEADLIGRAIKEYYIKRKPEARPEVITGEDLPAEAEEEEEEREPADLYDITGATLNLSVLSPFGIFSDIAERGFGIEAVLNGRSPVFPYITINPGITVYLLSPGTENIKSGYMILPEVTLGYNIQASEKIILAPVAGAGYSFMFIDGTTADGQGVEFYYNPALRAGIEFLYMLAPGYSIFTEAAYRCIFESDSVLQSVNINMGIRMNLL